MHETLRGPMNFKGPLLKNNIKIDTKTIKNEGAKKASQKALQNRFSEPFWSPKPSPKSKKNHTRVDAKKKAKKIILNRSKKKPVLASEREARSSLRNVGTR